MPVERTIRLSISQFSELLGLDPERLVDVEVHRRLSTVVIVQEPTDETAPSPDATGHP